jgi:hypothetical protein
MPRAWELGCTPMLLPILFLFTIFYLVFMFFSISFFDRAMPLDNRMLSPIFPAAVILSIGTGQRWLSTFHNSKPILTATMLGCILFPSMYADAAVHRVFQAHQKGFGYASREWHESGILRKVVSLPHETLVYTNGADVLTLLIDRLAGDLPEKAFQHSDRINPNYDSEIEAL